MRSATSCGKKAATGDCHATSIAGIESMARVDTVGSVTGDGGNTRTSGQRKARKPIQSRLKCWAGYPKMVSHAARRARGEHPLFRDTTLLSVVTVDGANYFA
jgi:hypothetical protein